MRCFSAGFCFYLLFFWVCQSLAEKLVSAQKFLPYAGVSVLDCTNPREFRPVLQTLRLILHGLVCFDGDVLW